jgi:hypothetical protein
MYIIAATLENQFHEPMAVFCAGGKPMEHK